MLALNLKCSVYSRFEWVYTVWVFSASGYLWCVEGKCNGKQDLALFLFKKLKFLNLTRPKSCFPALRGWAGHGCELGRFDSQGLPRPTLNYKIIFLFCTGACVIISINKLNCKRRIFDEIYVLKRRFSKSDSKIIEHKYFAESKSPAKFFLYKNTLFTRNSGKSLSLEILLTKPTCEE